MTFEEAIHYEIDRLTREWKTLKTDYRKAAPFPEGSFFCAKNGPYCKWFEVKSKNGKRTLRYISKKDKAFAKKLAFKTYGKMRITDLENAIRLLQQFSKRYRRTGHRAERLINENTFFRDLIEHPPVKLSALMSEWETAKYSSEHAREEGKTIRTVKGIYVRSKSEDLIAHELYMKGIPFHYEEDLLLGNMYVNPDFTIRHPMNGNIIIWEHFGMMGNEEYAMKALQKLNAYRTCGYVPGVNMIATFESMAHPLSASIVDAEIDAFFLVD